MRIDLYIHKDLEQKVSQEPKPGQLINSLLKTYYGILEPIPLEKATKIAKDYALCKHQSVKGFCKQGCK